MKNITKKKIQMNLDNCRYLVFLFAYATLDSTKKECSERLTDGEELKNRQRLRS